MGYNVTIINFLDERVKDTLPADILSKIHTLFANCDEKTYSRGDIITFADQDPDGIYLLLDGTVEQYDVTPEGNKITVNIFKPTAFFPMSWAINKTPNTYYFAALTTVKLKKTSPSRVTAFLQENPDVTYNLLSRVFKGTDALLRRLALAASGAASHRIIYELIIEAKRFGGGLGSGSGVVANNVATKVGRTRVLVRMRHNSLAARTGLARETVSRELHKLEDANYIALVREGIVVDVPRLEAVLDFEV